MIRACVALILYRLLVPPYLLNGGVQDRSSSNSLVAMHAFNPVCAGWIFLAVVSIHYGDDNHYVLSDDPSRDSQSPFLGEHHGPVIP
jgi:hypothetical protein